MLPQIWLLTVIFYPQCFGSNVLIFFPTGFKGIIQNSVGTRSGFAAEVFHWWYPTLGDPCSLNVLTILPVTILWGVYIWSTPPSHHFFITQKDAILGYFNPFFMQLSHFFNYFPLICHPPQHSILNNIYPCISSISLLNNLPCIYIANLY